MTNKEKFLLLVSNDKNDTIIKVKRRIESRKFISGKKQTNEVKK